MQLAAIAVIGYDIHIEPGIGLFQQGIYDGGDEIRFAIGGDDDAEAIVPRRDAGRSVWRVDACHFTNCMEEQQEKWLYQV